MTLTRRELELAAVAISVTAGCKPCTSYHMRRAAKAEATEDEIHQAITDALSMREVATAVMRGHALQTPPDAGDGGGALPTGTPDRVGSLVRIGAAYGANCPTSLDQALEAGEALGITEDDIRGLVRMGDVIKARAASHVKALVGTPEDAETRPPEKQSAGGRGCCG